MTLTPNGYVFLGLTALVAGMAAVVMFAVLRFLAAARDTRRNIKGGGGVETALLSAALQEAVERLKAQERATAARAEASERLSGEIISSLTAGLLVVGLQGEIRILNPAGRRTLDLPESLALEAYQRSPHQQPLLDVVNECLRLGTPIVRRAVVLPDTYRSGALLVAERIVTEVRRAFATRRIAACPLALTVSVGVAWYGATCSTRSELVEAADRALYQAKAAGGDCVAEAC